jgi:hypothetical protein
MVPPREGGAMGGGKDVSVCLALAMPLFLVVDDDIASPYCHSRGNLCRGAELLFGIHKG